MDKSTKHWKNYGQKAEFSWWKTKLFCQFVKTTDDDLQITKLIANNKKSALKFFNADSMIWWCCTWNVAIDLPHGCPMQRGRLHCQTRSSGAGLRLFLSVWSVWYQHIASGVHTCQTRLLDQPDSSEYPKGDYSARGIAVYRFYPYAKSSHMSQFVSSIAARKGKDRTISLCFTTEAHGKFASRIYHGLPWWVKNISLSTGSIANNCWLWKCFIGWFRPSLIERVSSLEGLTHKKTLPQNFATARDFASCKSIPTDLLS